jgi:hypothetical protein
MNRRKLPIESEIIFVANILAHIIVILLLAAGFVASIVGCYKSLSYVKVSLSLFCLIAIHMTGHNMIKDFNGWRIRNTYAEYYARDAVDVFKVFYTRHKPATKTGKLLFALISLCISGIIIYITIRR